MIGDHWYASKQQFLGALTKWYVKKITLQC